MGFTLPTTRPAPYRVPPALRTCALAVGALVCCTFSPADARSSDLAAIYAGVKPSVVYIVCATSDGVSSGTGFIYASGDAASYVITANHVVDGASKIDVVLDSDPKHRYEATVVKRDHARDVAELSIPVGHRVALTLQAAADVREGMSIATVGYPRAAKKFEELMGDRLRPSVHSGIVSAVRLSGEIVQFDAETDHGDSGGPVIDSKSGRVVGVMRGGLLDQSYSSAGLEALPGSNFAASSSTIAAVFGDGSAESGKAQSGKAQAAKEGMVSANHTMDSANTAMAAANSSMAAANSGMASADATMASAKAAVASTGGSTSTTHVNLEAASSSAEYRIGLATPHYDDPNLDALATRLATRVGARFATGHQVYVVPVTAGVAEASNAKIAGYCDDTRLNAIVAPHVRLSRIQPTGDRSLAGRKTFATLELKIADCSGNAFFSAEKTTPQAIAFASRSQDRDIAALFDGMLEHLFGDFDRFRTANAGAWTSLLKTGIALDPVDDRYQSLIGFEKGQETTGFTVTTVYMGGPGSVAGIKEGDTVIAVDGHAVRGSSRDEFLRMLNVSSYAISVLRPGGMVVLQVAPKKYAQLQASLKR